MNKNKLKVPKSLLDEIITKYSPLSSGATLSRANFFPKELTQLGINKRNPDKNDFLGTIFSTFNSDELVIGISYWDKIEKSDNEDFYVLNKITGYLEKFMGQYEKFNKLYKGAHKGKKDFLKR